MKRFFRFILIATMLIATTALVGIYIFFKKNDAPVLHGELDYNVSYNEAYALDVYHPVQPFYEKTPVVIYFHGGAWVTGAKESVNNARFNGAFNRLREKGYAVISPNYTLGRFEKSPFPVCLDDALDVMIWVNSNAETYNFDLDNIGILGESAGAHISLMTAFSEDGALSSVVPRYVVDVYGPTDLLQLYKDQTPLIDSLHLMAADFPESLQDYLDITKYLFAFDPAQDSIKTQDFTEQFSPVHKVRPNLPPVLIIHGDKDRVVPLSQSYILKDHLDTHKIPNEMHILKGVDHAFMNATDEQKHNTQNWIVDFVLRHYQ